MQTQMILFEGMPATANLARRVNDYFSNHMTATLFYPETHPRHPLDMTWRGCLTGYEYAELLDKYPEDREALKKYALTIGDYVLVPHKEDIDLKNEELRQYLMGKEISFTRSPALPPEAYRKLFEELWRSFGSMAALSCNLCVFTNVFLLHQVHDLIRGYNADNALILSHLQNLLNAVMPLNPVLFYINENLGNSRWEQTYPPEKAAWLRRCKSTCFEAMDKLPLCCYVLNNSDNDEDLLFDLVMRALKK